MESDRYFEDLTFCIAECDRPCYRKIREEIIQAAHETGEPVRQANLCAQSPETCQLFMEMREVTT
jgi:hypothetical protein